MTGDRDAAARYLENWQDEVDSAAEYRAMAAAEPDHRLAKVYRVVEPRVEPPCRRGARSKRGV